MTETDLPVRIRVLLERAMQAMTEAAGEQSLCAIAKSGEPVPALKYHEGRAAMLSRLEMALRTDVPMAEVHDKWEKLAPRAHGSADWRAYLQGGRDVWDELVPE